MLIAGCLLETDAFGPPDNPVTLLQPSGWCHFFTANADAWIWPMEREFILQWIESKRKGDGTILMRGINQWANAFGMRYGRLICEPGLVPFYEKFKWTRGDDYGDDAQMIWRPVA